MTPLHPKALEAAAREFAGVDEDEFEDDAGRYEWLQFFLHHTENGRKMSNSITAYLQEADDGWQPIETAPKDGSNFLVSWDGVTRIACWCSADRELFGNWSGWVELPGLAPVRPYSEAPTCWRPLPPPPGEKE